MNVKLDVEKTKQYMYENGVTEAELARKMNIDHSFVYRVLRGQRRPGPKFIAGMLHATGLGFDNLFILEKSLSVDKKNGEGSGNVIKTG